MINDIRIVIDPLNNYPKLSKKDMLESCGYIPDFVLEVGARDLVDDLVKGMEKIYGYGKLTHLTEGKLDERGCFIFPGDPVLFPIVTYHIGEKIIHQYRSGILAIEDKDESFFITVLD